MTAIIETRPPLELWFVDLTACGAALDMVEQLTPRLSPAEHKKIAGGISPAAIVERRAAYIALRVLIERFWGPDWRTEPYRLTGSGKPSLPGLSGTFSLSHVDKYALIGLARSCNIGVDLEPDRQPTVSDDRRQRVERAAISLAHGAPLPEPRQARFLQAWVRLEAVAKADGRGIGRLLTGLGIVGGDGGDDATTVPRYASDIAARFWVRDVAVSGGCVGAAALDQPFTPVPARVLPATAAEIEALTATTATS